MFLGAKGDRLIETVLLSTHTICFELLFIDPDKKILIFLPINLNMCFGCSVGPSFEYPHHMFWMR